MAVLHVTGFRGEVPRNSPRLIGNPFAQIAQNCKLYAGRIDPMRKPALVHESALTQEIRTFFHYHYKDSATWLAWPQVIDIVQSPIAGDERGRLYFSGLGELAMTTWADGVEGSSGPFPAKWFRLGVENPLAAPTAVASGGSAPNETRVYVWTWVTRYAEESGPSPAATVTGNIDGTWTISGFDAPYKNSGTVSAVASASGTAVATVDSTYGMTAGCVVVLAGTNMAAWNTRVTVKEVTDATHFTFETKTLGTFSGNATWALLNPHNTTGLKRRIYRTSGTNATPRLVAELDISQSSYADTKPTKDLLINLETIETVPPPKGLHSLVGLPNGAFAALVKNELCFSDPYKPHSWPVAYRYSFPATGVALSTAGNSVVVLTDSFPYLATANSPAAVNLSQIETYAPCVAKSGAVDIGDGCFYPGHDGLYMAGGGQVRNMTAALFKRDEWKAMNPESFYAAFHDGRYYARHKVTNGSDEVLVLDLADGDVPTLVRVDFNPSAVYASQYDGNLYVAQGTKLYQWDTDVGNMFLAQWKSKEYVMTSPVNFAFAQVYAEFPKQVPDNTSVIPENERLLADPQLPNGALTSAPLNTNSLNASKIRPVKTQSAISVDFTLMKEGEIIYSRKVRSNQPFRLPAGFSSDRYSFYVSSTVPVHSIAVAELMSELKQIQP